MNGWPIKLLGEVATVVRGVSFDKSQVRDEPSQGFIPILRAGNIQGSLLTDSDLVYVPSKIVSEDQRMKAGDLAICMSSGSPAIVGKTAHIEFDWDGAVGAFCSIVRFKNILHHRFASYWFRSPSFLQWRDSNAKGANIQNLRRSDLEKLLIPVPPLSEQARIVKILDEADELRKLSAKVDSQTAKLIPALFNVMFGEPDSNIFSWPITKIGEVVKISTEKVDPSEHPETTYNYVGLEHIEGHTGRLLNCTPTKGEQIKSSKNIFHGGEILYGKLRPYLNKVHLAKADGICSTDIFVLKVKKEVAEPLFIETYLKSTKVLTEVTSAMAGANLPRISKDSLLSISIPLPPLPLQNEFARRVSEIHAIEAEQVASRTSLDALFKSLLHRAFNGEL